MATKRVPVLDKFEWQKSVKDKDLSTPPTSPSVGDRYIVASSATGDWSGHDDEIAQWNGSSWDFTEPLEGMFVFVEDEDELYYYTTTWQVFSGVGGGTPGGNDGQIQYNDGGSFNGATDFYYDDENDRVGIGTSSPSEKLHISGGVAIYDPDRTIDDLHHLVDKQYVDEAVTSLGARYYMLDTDSGISDYKLCSLTPSAGSEQSVSVSDLTDGQYIAGWISPNTDEPDKLITGVFNWRIYAAKTSGSGSKTLRLYWKLVERKSDNSETVIGTSVISNEIVTGKNMYIIPLTLSSDHDIASDSYVVGKLYADVSGNGTAPSVTLYFEGDSDSHWQIPVNLEIFDNRYVSLIEDQTISGTKTFSTVPVLGSLNGIIKASSGNLSGNAVINDLNDVNISSPADGEVLTYDNGQWVNEAGGLIKVAEVNVSSNTTYVEFTNLDGNSAWFYKLLSVIKNPVGTNSYVDMFVNGDTVVSHYYSQYIHGSGTSSLATRLNRPIVGDIVANDRSSFEITITKDPDGYFRGSSQISRATGSGVTLSIFSFCKTATITNITSLRVQASVSNGIGAGSKFILYKARR